MVLLSAEIRYSAGIAALPVGIVEVCGGNVFADSGGMQKTAFTGVNANVRHFCAGINKEEYRIAGA